MTSRHIPGLQWHPTRVSEVMLGALGLLSLVLGLVVLVAGDNEYVGLGGDLSWRVGDLSAWWGFGLIAVGVAALFAMLTLIRRDRAHTAAGEASGRSGMADLLIHAGVFVAVNALLWAQDIAIGDGLNYAHWATIPWGVGLVVQAWITLRDRRRERLGPG